MLVTYFHRFRNQVYFKAAEANGSWSTYVQSFRSELLIAFGVMIVIAMAVLASTYTVSVRMGITEPSTRDNDFDGFDFFGSCFIAYGALCQQGMKHLNGLFKI